MSQTKTGLKASECRGSQLNFLDVFQKGSFVLIENNVVFIKYSAINPTNLL